MEDPHPRSRLNTAGVAVSGTVTKFLCKRTAVSSSLVVIGDAFVLVLSGLVLLVAAGDAARTTTSVSKNTDWPLILEE
jgi:hypothetical protein